MGKHEVPRQTPLERRIQTASKDLHIIMKDLQRDCKPYWKFSELERELLDIADSVKRLGADHRREVSNRKAIAAEVRKVAEQAKKNMKELKA